LRRPISVSTSVHERLSAEGRDVQLRVSLDSDNGVVLNPAKNKASVSKTDEMKKDVKNAYAALSLSGSARNLLIASTDIFMVLATVLMVNCFVQDEAYEDFPVWLRNLIILLSAFASIYAVLASRFTSVTREERGFLRRHPEVSEEGRELLKDFSASSKKLAEFAEFNDGWNKFLYIPDSINISETEIDMIIRKVCNTTPNNSITLIRDKEMETHYQRYIRQQKRLKSQHYGDDRDDVNEPLLADDGAPSDLDDDNASPTLDKMVIVTYKLPPSKYPTRERYWNNSKTMVAIIYGDALSREQCCSPIGPVDFFRSIPRYVGSGLSYSMVTWGPAIAIWLTCNKSFDHIFESWGFYKFFPSWAKLIIYPAFYWASGTRVKINNRMKGHYIWDYLYRKYTCYSYGLDFTQKKNKLAFILAALITAVPAYFHLSFAVTNAWFFFDSGVTATASQITTMLDLLNQLMPASLQGVNQMRSILASVDPNIYRSILMFLRVWIISSNVVITGVTNVKPLFDLIYKWVDKLYCSAAPQGDLENQIVKPLKADTKNEKKNSPREEHNYTWFWGYILLQLAVAVDSLQYGVTAGYTTREILKQPIFDCIFVGEWGVKIRAIYPYISAVSIGILGWAWTILKAEDGFTGTLNMFNTKKIKKVLKEAEGGDLGALSRLTSSSSVVFNQPPMM